MNLISCEVSHTACIQYMGFCIHSPCYNQKKATSLIPEGKLGLIIVAPFHNNSILQHREIIRCKRNRVEENNRIAGIQRHDLNSDN